MTWLGAFIGKVIWGIFSGVFKLSWGAISGIWGLAVKAYERAKYIKKERKRLKKIKKEVKIALEKPKPVTKKEVIEDGKNIKKLLNKL